MIKALLFDFSRVILFPKNKNYTGGLNALHNEQSKKDNFNFHEHFELNSELIKHLDILRKKYELFVFTSETIQDAPEVKPILEKSFSRIISAKKLGLNKEDSAAYAEIARLIGKKPEEILFIDDKIGNLEAAKEAGMRTLNYKSNYDLMENLEIIED